MSRSKQNFRQSDLGKVIKAAAKSGSQFRIEIEGNRIVIVPAKQDQQLVEAAEWN